MARDQSASRVDLPFAVEGLEQSGTDFLHLVGKVVQPLAIFSGQSRWRHVEVAGEVDRHRPVKHPAPCPDPAILRVLVGSDPLQALMNGVGIGEDTKSRLPVGMLIGGAETGYAQCRRIGERT